ncbi:MAG: aconitate hydratase AcnA [Roseibium sp.]
MRTSRGNCAAGNSIRLPRLKEVLGPEFRRLPHVLRLLAENHLRTTGDHEGLRDALKIWLNGRKTAFEFSFQPNRLLMHDTTCTPALADIAALRDVLAETGADPETLSPTLLVEVSVDHSLSVDVYGLRHSLETNSLNELNRNRERYAFMKWASNTLEGVHVNPPGSGIMHTINLEQLANVLEVPTDGQAHPDMMLGTDSHTPMINGLGVLAWGIGGLEAESIMFGQSVSLAVPEVVGVYLSGELPAGVFSTDLAIEVTKRLRDLGVAGSFVEFFGEGVSGLSADSRAVIANMAPEYGATTGFFPVDQNTISYLERTGRSKELTKVIEPSFKAMNLWFDPNEKPQFDREIEINLSNLSPIIAGPRRPQDKLKPQNARSAVEFALSRPLNECGHDEVPDGAVGVAAITSCTNTSDPRLLVASGLLALKADLLGLKPPSWVKTSLAPGSPSAKSLLKRSGLLKHLDSIGFGIVGFGCTTCIGNSGPLPLEIDEALKSGKAIVAVLSGNRNFPGRVHPKLDLAFLASPPLVIAFALKGDIHGDIHRDPIGVNSHDRKIYLSDIWPDEEEIDRVLERSFRTEDVKRDFKTSLENDPWNSIPSAKTPRFPWDPNSRSLRRPKFVSNKSGNRLGNYSARPLLVFGNDMTTDHISPAGWVDPDSEAGKWLVERGGDPSDLNVYASYRGNWEVMLRGLFTNRLARNYLASDLSPAWTQLACGRQLPVYKAAELLEKEGHATVLLAGERYGMGSSRDWAAKGVALLGVRAVIARSFERIHRSNLIGMGVLPIKLTDDFSPKDAGVTPADWIDIEIRSTDLRPGGTVPVTLRRQSGMMLEIAAIVAVETMQEVELLKAGGVLSSIIRNAVGSVDGLN